MLNYKQLREQARMEVIQAHNRAAMPFLAIIIGFLTICLLVVVAGCAYSSEVINVDRLANAIYISEGGAKTAHPYGILAHYKHTTPRQVCINTIKHALREYKLTNTDLYYNEFICYLGATYAPTGNIANDPGHLNDNWIRNVRWYYEKG